MLALAGLALAALALGTTSDPYAVRFVTVWTARLTLLLFLPAFVVLGHRPVASTHRIACRAAAFAMALHVLALTRLASLTGEGPVAIHTVLAALLSFGGVAAAALVVMGWTFWDRPWYRWSVYWPWSVFLFTYIMLKPQGAEAARVFAAPLVFGPVVAVLLVALGWRIYLDMKNVNRRSDISGTLG
jgi:hypothetical protein